MSVEDPAFEIRPIKEDELNAILEVYRECEDFLELGPEPKASMEMVLSDIKFSKEAQGIFCGIYDLRGKMIGIVDFVPKMFAQKPDQAFISLIMIAQSYRNQGIGSQVVTEIECKIMKNPEIKTILSAVQINNEQAIKFWERKGYRIFAGPEIRPDNTTVYHLMKRI
jgi:ribosomal protein S18 acetylase RimI-like enzyme